MGVVLGKRQEVCYRGRGKSEDQVRIPSWSVSFARGARGGGAVVPVGPPILGSYDHPRTPSPLLVFEEVTAFLPRYTCPDCTGTTHLRTGRLTDTIVHVYYIDSIHYDYIRSLPHERAPSTITASLCRFTCPRPTSCAPWIFRCSRPHGTSGAVCICRSTRVKTYGTRISTVKQYGQTV